MLEPDAKLSILIVDDEESTARAFLKLLASLGHRAFLTNSGEEALKRMEKGDLDLVITDLMMPGMDGFVLVKKIKESYPHLLVIIFTGHDSFSIARRALTLGADDFLLKPINKDQLTIALSQAREKINLKNKVANLNKLVESKYSLKNIIGNSEPMQKVFRLIEKAKSIQSNVLIIGESGTGKELVARAIYSAQSTQIGRFVEVNCCAISEGLFESELFGHIKGSFSGAVADREGLFEVANNGTIFLDEIGELTLNIQMKLLRAIQEREIRRVGDNKIKYVNVRIIAATNKNLEEAVKNGEFREDLYYRLNVIPINLPSLRERLNDVPVLAAHFIQKHCPEDEVKVISHNAMKKLQEYHYPGNVRELENIIQRAISFSSGQVIRTIDISSHFQKENISRDFSKSQDIKDFSYPQFKDYIKEVEKEYLAHHLKKCGGSVNQAAKGVHITRTAFHNKITKLGINLAELRQS